MINVVPVIIKEEKHRGKKTDKNSNNRRTVDNSKHSSEKLTSEVILTENCFNLISVDLIYSNLIRCVKATVLIYWSCLCCVLSHGLVTNS
jgi:hypothetical protein